MKNPFWRWVRLREGREVFKASTQLIHDDGTVVTVSVEGKNAEYVSAVMNGIKLRYSRKTSETTEDHDHSPWAAFERMLRRNK